VPARPAKFAEVPSELLPQLVLALKRQGRDKLYSHQAEAINYALGGEHVIQSTSAGSGKSIGLLAPVFDQLFRSENKTAILVYPLRALANDQLAAIRKWGVDGAPWINQSSFDLRIAEELPSVRVARYDGATIESERPEARRNGRLIVTTPDMLHVSLLQNSRKSWERLFRHLEYVVLDEVHAYKGVFGSNVGQVIRRLRRIADHFNRQPKFLAASATIGNPKELVERVTGVPDFQVVDEDGSPTRRRIVLVCNPPLIRQQAGTQGPTTPAVPPGRVAPQTVAIELMARGTLVSPAHDPVRTICFCLSRNAVFALSERTRLALNDLRRADLREKVQPYAATFMDDDRLDAEGKVRDGSTLAIVSTNALELGIDIPELSVAVLVGYPGQISSFRQQIGRVGRKGEGLAILICGDDPLQQYLARTEHALEALLNGPAEDVVVSPEVEMIARRSGLAPAQEEFGGIAYEDEVFLGPAVSGWLAAASGAPDLVDKGISYWRVPVIGDAYEGLRNAVASATFTVLKMPERRPVGVIDAATAPRDAFVPAIWTAAGGELYEITGFGVQQREIYCSGPVSPGFQTRGISVDQVAIENDLRERRALGIGTVGYAELEITRQVFSYKEQHFSGQELTKNVASPWPPQHFRTTGLYFNLVPLSGSTSNWEGSVRALEHVLLSASPSIVACDPYDLESSSTKNGSALYIYDSFGGDLRIGEPIYNHFDRLAHLAHEMVSLCPCPDGCPSCIMLSRRPDGNQNLDKAGAIVILDSLIQQLV
jgi:DEAD/DEAH box helicase domain-containing protein